MSIILIPLRHDIFQYNFTKELGGIVYLFRFGYNLRCDSWFMNIGDIATPIRLALGGDLLRQFHHLEVPPGALEMIDLDGLYTDPNKTNLGDRVIMQYTEI